MKILRPVDPAVRLPEIKKGDVYSKNVLLHCKTPNESFLLTAHCNIEGEWYRGGLSIVYIIKNPVVWYEEIEIESLFPDDEKCYNTASNACNGSVYKIGIFQEGISYFKNYLLKQLKK
jgi:hypothetical protein